MMEHPKDEILIDYLLDELTEPETRMIREHLESCDLCSEKVRKLMRVMNVLDEIPEVETDGRIAEKVLNELNLSDEPVLKILPSEEITRIARSRRPILTGFAVAAIILLSTYLIQVYSPPGTFFDRGVLNARLEIPSRVSPNATVPVNLSLWDETGKLKKSGRDNLDVEFMLTSDNQSSSIDKATLPMEATSTRQINLSGVKDGSYELKAIVGGREVASTPLAIGKTYEITVLPDRPIYKPNDTVNVRIAAREVSGDSASGEKVIVVFNDPLDGLIKQEEKTLDDFGTVGFSYPIPDLAPYGEYTITVKIGEYKTQSKIIVDDYTLPSFEVKSDLPEYFILSAPIHQGTVRANWFFGKPVTDSDVRIEWYASDSGMLQLINTIEGKTDNFGEFKFALDVANEYPERSIPKNTSETSYLKISVTEKSGRTEEIIRKIEISENPILIKAYPENGKINPGLVNRFYIFTSTPDGSPVSVDLNIKIVNEAITGKTSNLGLFIFDYKVIDSNVGMKVDVKDQTDINSSDEFSFSTSDESQSDLLPLILRSEKAQYKYDEPIQLKLFVPFAVIEKASLDAYKGNQWIASREVEIKDNDTLIEWLIPNASGEIIVEASAYSGFGVIGHDRTRLVISDPGVVEIDIKIDKSVYGPSETVKTQVDVKSGGQPEQASLGVIVSDRSLKQAGDIADTKSRIVSGILDAELAQKYESLSDEVTSDQIAEFNQAVMNSSISNEPKLKSVDYKIDPKTASRNAYNLTLQGNSPLVVFRIILAGLMYLSVIMVLIASLSNIHRGTFRKLTISNKALRLYKGFAVLTSLAAVCFSVSIYYPSTVILAIGLFITFAVAIRLAKCMGSAELVSDSFALTGIIAAMSILICALLIAHQGIWEPMVRNLGRVYPFMSYSSISILVAIGCIAVLSIVVIPERGGGKDE